MRTVEVISVHGDGTDASGLTGSTDIPVTAAGTSTAGTSTAGHDAAGASAGVAARLRRIGVETRGTIAGLEGG